MNPTSCHGDVFGDCISKLSWTGNCLLFVLLLLASIKKDSKLLHIYWGPLPLIANVICGLDVCCLNLPGWLLHQSPCPFIYHNCYHSEWSGCIPRLFSSEAFETEILSCRHSQSQLFRILFASNCERIQEFTQDSQHYQSSVAWTDGLLLFRLKSQKAFAQSPALHANWNAGGNKGR